ncbi:MAG: thioredoxin family protein [Prevotella sp.]|nr:thioredoxin family protein [Prevotella sp.]
MMRRFTILAVAALAAVTTAFGQSAPKRQKAPQAKEKKMPEKKRVALSEVTLNSNIFTKGKPQQAVRSQIAKSREANRLQVRGAARKAAKARKANSGIIIDQPEGKYYDMVLSTWYYVSSLFGASMGENSGAIGEVVEGTDGYIYIHNLITELATEEGFWVKAEKLGGDTIVIHEQPIWDEDYYGTIYTHSIMKLKVEDGSLTYDPRDSDIKMIWKDGKLDTVDEFNTGEDFQTVITAIDNEGYWCGAMNWDVHMWPQTDEAITQLPETSQTSEMVMKYTDEYGELVARKVNVAIDGTNVFLQINPEIDAWVMGTLEGDKAIFPSRQYLGKDLKNSCHAYLLIADANDELIDQAVFTFDPANNTFTSASEVAIYVNSGKSDIYYIDRFENPSIFYFVEVPGTPQKPSIEDVEPYEAYPSYAIGYGYVYFYAPYFDAEGNYLDPDKMYYKVYVDDEVYTFQPSDYPYDLEEATDIIPFSFNGYDFANQEYEHEFYTYFQPAKNIGVQLIYTGGGETHESETAWYEVDSYLADGEEGVLAHVEDGAPNTELNDGEIALNLGFAESKDYSFGTAYSSDETFDVAFHLSDPSLVGAQIVAINVPFFDTQEISGTKVWLSKSLSVSNGVFTADALTQDFEAGKGFTKVVLNQPYTITEDGIYIGYTFTQAANPQATPVVLTGYTSDGGFIVHTDKVYKNGWFNMYMQYGDLALEAVLKGDNIKAFAVSPEYAQDIYAQVNQESQVRMDVTNYGYEGAKNIDYTYEVAGQSGTGHIDLDPALEAAYGAFHTFSIPIPAIAQKGTYPLTIKVTKVNGEANAALDDTDESTVNVLTVMPKKRPVLEEYTGTWCGYCPRGYVALQKMNKLYPNDFIALSYHNDDPMEFTYYFPSNVEGFPDAWLDRVHQTDAYCGDGAYGEWGIEKVWLDRCKEFGVADLSVTADWADENKNTIDIRTTAIFPLAIDNNPYILEYALVTDGLKGVGSEWSQSNYYSGASGWPADMLKFIAGGDYVNGLVFDDVIIAREPVKGALPTAIAEDGVVSHSYQMFADDALNTSYEPIIQDKDKVRVVAMLVNSRTGEIVNAANVKVMPAGTGIKGTTEARTVDSVSYYDLSGRKVLLPNNGIYIQSIRYKDGSTSNKKVLVK